jgi:hypothetical protein
MASNDNRDSGTKIKSILHAQTKKKAEQNKDEKWQ